MENPEVSLGRKAHFLLGTPQRPSGMWEKVHRILSRAQPSMRSQWAGKWLSLRSEGKLRLMRTQLHRPSSPQPLVPCSFLQLRRWLGRDSRRLGAGQDINLLKQCLDSCISSAEYGINLIKQ